MHPSVKFKPSNDTITSDSLETKKDVKSNEKRKTSEEEEEEEEATTKQRRRKKLGRSSRRRRAKLKAMDRNINLEDQEENNENDESSNFQFGNDVSVSLPGVQIRRREERRLQKQQESRSDNEKNNTIKVKTNKLEENGVDSNEMDPWDVCAIESQLGYVPSNAISVASRVCDLSPSLQKALLFQQQQQEKQQQEQQQQCSTKDHFMEEDFQKQPTVLKLYPLTVRKIHWGGKGKADAHGRRYKRRKRVGDENTLVNDDAEQTNNGSAMVDNEAMKEQPVSTQPNDNTKSEEENLETQCPKNVETAIKSQKQQQRPKEQQQQQQKQQQQNPAWTLPDGYFIEPFPTVFWLTHPILRNIVSKLEMDPNHNVKWAELQLQQHSKDNSGTSFSETMTLAHKSYQTERWMLCTSDDQMFMQQSWNLNRRGVAGIRLKKDGDTNNFGVKCLHAHVAHYLSGCKENLVGQWTMDAICAQWNNSEEEACRKMGYAKVHQKENES